MKTKSSESEILQSSANDINKINQPDVKTSAVNTITDEDRHHLVEKIDALCDCV